MKWRSLLLYQPWHQTRRQQWWNYSHIIGQNSLEMLYIKYIRKFTFITSNDVDLQNGNNQSSAKNSGNHNSVNYLIPLLIHPTRDYHHPIIGPDLSIGSLCNLKALGLWWQPSRYIPCGIIWYKTGGSRRLYFWHLRRRQIRWTGISQLHLTTKEITIEVKARSLKNPAWKITPNQIRIAAGLKSEALKNKIPAVQNSM